MRKYVSYGSNMDLEQMEWRCPDAELVCSGTLRDYRLLFKGSKTGSYATVEPCEGAKVPVLVWEISEEDERSLDRYEGYPTFYQKEDVAVETKCGTLCGMVYIMDPRRQLGAPSEWYYDVLERAYERFGFDKRILETALEDSMGQARKA